MAKTVILTGGPCDGQKVAVPHDVTQYMVRGRSHEDVPLLLACDEPLMASGIGFLRGRYIAINDRQVFEWQGWEE